MVIAALVVIFCAGQGVGYLWAARLSNRSEKVKSGLEMSWAQNWTDATMTQLQQQLHLTDTQMRQIEPVLQQTGDKISTERRRALFQIHLNILDVHSGIQSYLSEDQKDTMEDSQLKLKRRMQRDFPEIMENTEK